VVSKRQSGLLALLRVSLFLKAFFEKRFIHPEIQAVVLA
jgi:hypothetical protein